MQKLLIISLFSIHLFGNTEFTEVLRLPSLITHYTHHINRGDRISFIDFVAAHYGKGDRNQADNREEQSLPFYHFYPHSFSMALIPDFNPGLHIFYTTLLESEPAKLHIHTCPSGFFGALLKPPRFIA